MKKKKKQKNKNIITAVVAAVAAVFCSLAAVMVLTSIDVSPFPDEPFTEEAAAVNTTEKVATNENVTADKTTEKLTKEDDITEKATTAKENSDETKTDRIVINPNQEQWNLVVVNMSREMPRDYKPVLKEILSTGYYMDERVVPHYEEMYKEAKKEGIILTPYSGYRSYERQERNYKNLTEDYMSRYGISRKEAAKKAATVILPPGTSEHNLGLAMDICNTKNSFAKTKEYKWLTENAHKYGFILRYTADKMHITGIVDEPWHWRYVGVEHAEDIKNSGLCLEEYLDMKGIAY